MQLHLTTNDEIGGMIDFFVMCHEGQAFYLCGVTEKMEDGLTVEEAAVVGKIAFSLALCILDEKYLPSTLTGLNLRVHSHFSYR